jgi:NitT/TauT family transport system substrate-binding protein
VTPLQSGSQHGERTATVEAKLQSVFRIQPHGRLQEWVADEKGYFRDEGLEYEFVPGGFFGNTGTVQPAGAHSAEVKDGAFESIEAGRACEVSAACHWAVNMASSAEHGKMWGHAYSVTPGGIYVAPESPIRKPSDLAGMAIGVGYHSGSHFSALQALERVLKPEETTLRFIGRPFDRLAQLLDREIPAANIFGAPLYVLEQQGFRKVIDTTFMIGFLVTGDATQEQVEAYFRALKRAQRDIDLEPELYKHYFLRELPERYHGMVDVAAFGPGERIVFEPYTREMYERTHRWMEDLKLFPEEQVGHADYAEAVLV